MSPGYLSHDKRSIKSLIYQNGFYSFFSIAHTDQDPFIQSIIFSNKFKKKWLIDFPLESVNITIGFQDDEVRRFATFTFHKSRNGEVVHDINSLELYDQPIYVEVLS